MIYIIIIKIIIISNYSPEQFLSDVGGAAGLVMGMSVATLIGFGQQNLKRSMCPEIR